MTILLASQEVDLEVVAYLLAQPMPETFNGGVVHTLEGHKRRTFAQTQVGGKSLAAKGQSQTSLRWPVHNTTYRSAI